MSAEPRQNTNTDWTHWDGKVVNGAYLLRRFLGGSDHSGVFLTDSPTDNRAEVAIKFIPAESVQAEAQLVQWAATTTLSHPNLVRIFDVGRYRFEGREYLFAVMEYADQTLAEILPRRPLVVEEARELLLPTLDTLLFLHRKGLIHGRLRPSNFLAVNDRLKLSSDSIRSINHGAIGSARSSAYDPPELKDRGPNAAGDIWSLGMTLLEALTQHTTAWPDETVTVPADLPAPFANIVLRSLSIAPGVRPTALDIEAQFKPAPPASPAPPRPAPQPAVSQPPVSQAPPPPPKVAAPSPPAKKQQRWRQIASLAVPLSLAAWAVSYFLDKAPTPAPAPVAPAPAPVTPAVGEKPVEPKATAPTPPPPAPTKPTSAGVVHEVIPEVPADVRGKIRGRVYVTVRVLVGPDGNVVGTLMENAGPSKYFADLALQSAGEWKFVSTVKQNQRVWLVRFLFNRSGVSARAIAQ